MSRKIKKKIIDEIMDTNYKNFTLSLNRTYYPKLTPRDLVSIQPLSLTGSYSIPLYFKNSNFFMTNKDYNEYCLLYKLCKKCHNRFYNKLITSPVVCLENSTINKKGHCSKYKPNEFIISRRK